MPQQTGASYECRRAWNIDKWKPRPLSVYLIIKMNKGFGDVCMGLGLSLDGEYVVFTILATHYLGLSLDPIHISYFKILIFLVLRNYNYIYKNNII